MSTWVSRALIALLCLSGLVWAKTYTVQTGDSLWDISRRYGVPIQVLLRLNGLQGDTIQPGMVLRITVNSQPTLRSAIFQRGRAAWYGPGFHGRRTASGERFNTYALTAAHLTLPLGSRVRVTNLRNGRSVVVRVNDRGPYTRGYFIAKSRGSLELSRLGSYPVAGLRYTTNR